MKKILLLASVLSLATVVIPQFGFVSELHASSSNRSEQFDFYTVDKKRFKVCCDTIQSNIDAYAKILPENIKQSYWATSNEWSSSIDNLKILAYWGHNSNQEKHNQIVQCFAKQQVSEFQASNGIKTASLLAQRNGLGVYEALYLINHNENIKAKYEEVLDKFYDLDTYFEDKKKDAVWDFKKLQRDFTTELFTMVINNIAKAYRNVKSTLSSQTLSEIYFKNMKCLLHDLNIYLNQFGILTGVVVPKQKTVTSPKKKSACEELGTEYEYIDSAVDTISEKSKQFDADPTNTDTLINRDNFISELSDKLHEEYPGDTKEGTRDYIDEKLRRIGELNKNPVCLSGFHWKSDVEKLKDFCFSTLPGMIEKLSEGRKISRTSDVISDFGYVLSDSNSFPFDSSSTVLYETLLKLDLVACYLKDQVTSLVQRFDDDETRESKAEQMIKEFGFINKEFSPDKRSFKDVDEFIKRKRKEINQQLEPAKTTKKRQDQIERACLKIAKYLNIEPNKRLTECFKKVGCIFAGKPLTEIKTDMDFENRVVCSAKFLTSELPMLIDENNKSGYITIDTALSILENAKLDEFNSAEKLFNELSDQLKVTGIMQYRIKKLEELANVKIKSEETRIKLHGYLCRNYVKNGSNLDTYKTIDTFFEQHKNDITLINYIKSIKPADEFTYLTGLMLSKAENETGRQVTRSGICHDCVKAYLELEHKVFDYKKVSVDNPQFDEMWQDANEFFLKTLPLYRIEAKDRIEAEDKGMLSSNQSIPGIYERLLHSFYLECVDFFIYSSEKLSVANPKNLTELMDRVVNRVAKDARDFDSFRRRLTMKAQ